MTRYKMIKDTRKGFNRALARSKVPMMRFLEATPGGKPTMPSAPTVSVGRGEHTCPHK